MQGKVGEIIKVGDIPEFDLARKGALDQYGEWRTVTGFAWTSVIVSSKGYYWQRSRPDEIKIGKLSPSRGAKIGYCVVYIQGKGYRLHRLILCAFEGPPANDKIEGMHGDDNRLNNDITNLKWGTKSENAPESRKGRSTSMGQPVQVDTPNGQVVYVSVNAATTAGHKKPKLGWTRVYRESQEDLPAGPVMNAKKELVQEPAEDWRDLPLRKDGKRTARLSNRGRKQTNLHAKTPNDVETVKPTKGQDYDRLLLDNGNINGPTHCLLWELFNERKIPEGMKIDHWDRNTGNCSLSNLKLETDKGNMENRACSKKRARTD